MRAFLALIMRGRTQAVTAAAVSGVLSLIFPPLSYASGAVVSLATLKQGPREGALVVAGAVLLCAVFSMLMVGTPAPALAVFAMSWLPAWLIAGVLAVTRSQGMALLAAGAMGMLAVLMIYVLLGGDPGAWWRNALERFFAPALEQAGNREAAARLGDLLDVWAPRMTQYFGAAITGGLMLSLMLGRWGHSLLDNPGGFGQEFRQLRVGRPALLVAVVVGVVAQFSDAGPGRLAADLMGPIVAVLAFQGLAVAHAVARTRRAATGWLVALYLLLMVPPHLALPAVSLAGLLDGWMDFRARARKRNEESNDADHSS